MNLLQESFRALWAMALPVGVFSYLLVAWSLRRGHIKGDGGADALTREIKALAVRRKQQKKARKQGAAEQSGQTGEAGRHDPVYEKWMKFGGGFYGVVGFYTYLVIEVREIVAFIGDFGGLWPMIRRLDIGALVQLLVESITNFVAALAWPVYWLNQLSGRQPWLVFLAAYLGYWLGIRLALRQVRITGPVAGRGEKDD